MPQERLESSSFSPEIAEFFALLDKHQVLLESAGGTVPLYYISLGHLLCNKEAAGRPKDWEDLKYLRQAASYESSPGDGGKQ
jgi:hypothetical protein